MIAKSVTITYNVDDQTNIGICDGKYVQFIDEVAKDIGAGEIVDIYLRQNLRIPDEFVEVRECAKSRIDALQAVL